MTRATRSVRRRAWALVAALLLAGSAAACGDQGPVPSAGVLEATLASPHGAEGAAVVELLGEGIGGVTPVGETVVHAFAGAGRTRVVLIHPTGGTLGFRVAVQDTTRPPSWVVREVAGPDDQLRSTTAEYVLELRP